jgi:hypothetical protein
MSAYNASDISNSEFNHDHKSSIEIAVCNELEADSTTKRVPMGLEAV